MKNIASEKELAMKFIDYLSGYGYDLYFEVPTPSASITDIVGVQGNILTGFEVKTSCSIAVIKQAYHNLKHYHYSYICVNWSKKTDDFTIKICQDYGIGILAYSTDFIDLCSERAVPKLNRHIQKPTLEEWQRYSIAGSQGERLTAFKAMVDKLTSKIRWHKKLSMKEAFGDQSYYRNFTSFQSNIYQWCRSKVITEFYLEKGYLYLTEYGMKKDTIY